MGGRWRKDNSAKLSLAGILSLAKCPVSTLNYNQANLAHILAEMNYIFTQIVLANPETQYCDSSHFPTQTSAQASSNIKSTISFELLDLDKKFKRLNWLELNFPLNCSTFT